MAAAPKAAPVESGPSPRKTRVLVADEAGIMRDGLCALLQSDDALEVVAATGEALQTLTSAQPDVVIVDFATDLKSGPETIEHLKRRWPEVRVLVLTVRRDETFIETALRAGADGYVLKTDSRAELFNAVHRVASGKGYISPSALDRMVTAYAKTADRLPGHPRPAGALTSREQEVITLIAKGYRTREMAQLMSLSHKTVEKHRTNLMRKLGLRSAAAVAAYAITHGFV
ncbi:MAG: response regulator transcription factor [Gammaproteobacteria bacterium]|nr:MAG: response regulator transcription factor [Gammaproteobacteria bacterium]